MYMKTPISLMVFCLASATFAAEPVSLFTVQPHALPVIFAADGIIEAQQQTEVAAQLPGRVLEVRADAGQVVSKGQLLMRTDAREVAEVAAGAAAQYVNAQANYERTRRLVEQKFLAPAALDKAKSDFDAASAQRGASVATLSHALIVAPISGVVARRHAELGDLAQPGKPLFTLFAPGALRATASVPQSRLREVRQATQAQVWVPELERRVDSVRVTVLPSVDVLTHVAQVRVDLPATAEALAGVTPGMFVRVLFVTGSALKLTVPATAVVRRGELAAVYVHTDDKPPTLRQLRLGEAVGKGEIEVLAGLSAGEKVLTDAVKAAIGLRTGK